MKKRFFGKYALVLCLAACITSGVYSDEAFGFGDVADSSDEGGRQSPPGIAADGVKISGEACASVQSITDDLSEGDTLRDTDLGDVFSGKLGFSAAGSNADAVINLEVESAAADASPFEIDEAYVRAYWGKLDLEGGLRKLSWGKADSRGPLDVINPKDLSDLTETDELEQKIARPMLHASYSLASFTKLEGVFIPSFEGTVFSTEGRWAPARIATLKNGIADTIVAQQIAIGALSPAAAAQARASIGSALSSFDIAGLSPETSGLRYAQAGLRFTTTIGSTDLGIQYFSGNLRDPAISVDAQSLFSPTMELNAAAVSVDYNRYHQIGADYASVLGKFNVRSEVAANITEDLDGDDGGVYNPAFLWSVGFDRDVVAGINLNAQAAGSARLMDDNVGDTVSDAEAGSDMTKTTITVKLSKKVMKDELEFAATALYGIEDADYLVMPSVVWTKGDTEVKLSGGIFGGDDTGDLGQYDANDYASLSLTYRF